MKRGYIVTSCHLYNPINLLSLTPKGGHIFERLALGLGYCTPHKECSNNAYHAIHGVGKEGAELIQSRECRRHNVVEYPLEGYGYGDRSSTYGVGEYLGNEYPADRSP